MTRLIDICPSASMSDWDRLAESAENAAFADTSTWGRICEASFPNCKANARLYQFDDGVEVLLPGVIEKALGGAIKVFRSAHPFDYGGLVSSSPLTSAHVSAISKDLRSAGFSAVTLYESPFHLSPPLPGFEATGDFTHVLPIERGSDAVFNSMSPKQRQKLRRAANEGVRIEEHTDEYGVSQMYKLYRCSAARWGEQTTWLRPESFLRTAVSLGSRNVRILLTMIEDKPIGGQVDYLYGNVCSGGWRGFDYEYRDLYPNLAILWAAIDDACKRGMKWFDLGSSAGLEGVIESKERYGAVPIAYRRWDWRHPAYKAYSMGRRGVEHAQAMFSVRASH
ncbi:MAG: GNAT family N-acetyltransferase [Coriobacteriia bacterium]